MYICQDCGRTFEDPAVEYDDPSPEGVALPAGWYAYTSCPFCGSEDITEAIECAFCGEAIAPDFEICDDCLQKLDGEIELAIKGICEKFGEYSEETKAIVLDRIAEVY